MSIASFFPLDSLPTNILEILLLSALIYMVLRFFRGTSAQSVLTGVVITYLLIFVLYVALDWAKMRALQYAIQQVLTPSILAIFIVFQPELRRALLEIGGKVPVIFTGATSKTAVDSIIDACLWLSGNKMGALICVERQVKLGDITEQGTSINAEVSSELLKNIFFKESPLHDGAVVIRGSKIVAAQCLLPMSDNREIAAERGTRHRAALGLAEETDAIVIVVSEETQSLSLAVNGKLEYGLRAEVLKQRVEQLLELHDADRLSAETE